MILLTGVKFWKLIALALVALFSGLKRFFSFKKESESHVAFAKEGAESGLEASQIFEHIIANEQEPVTAQAEEAAYEMETKA
ncbi:hypothetical protein [Rufibacter aurantiacus]|uniref:hypothetical protein n=1 Tax=Rufibacter aurantiacus TaxID=2817374 RepID=UPI001B311870|nr:hypothetical protein [Rufibacter aurantiacus]